jgi:polyisoprenoid-binding protein YceI
MKKTSLILSTLVIGALGASCGGDSKSHDESHDEASHEGENHDAAAPKMAEAATWMVNSEASNVKWTGGTSGAQVYSHFGSIAIMEGKFNTNGEVLEGGAVIIDMTKISPEDESYSEEQPASDLVGHLSSPDFFDVEANPTATFNITSVNGSEVTGDLTVRGITHEETLMVEIMEVTPENMHVKGNLEFDRQKYDVAWEHYLEDVILSDMIALEFDINAAK